MAGNVVPPRSGYGRGATLQRSARRFTAQFTRGGQENVYKLRMTPMWERLEAVVMLSVAAHTVRLCLRSRLLTTGGTL